jgi:hypothetical protein
MSQKLLEYKPPNQSTPPFAPTEVWTQNMLNVTVLSWTWHSGEDGILNRGWFPLKKYNPDHPDQIAYTNHARSVGAKSSQRAENVIRYPFGC